MFLPMAILPPGGLSLPQQTKKQSIVLELKITSVAKIAAVHMGILSEEEKKSPCFLHVL